MNIKPTYMICAATSCLLWCLATGCRSEEKPAVDVAQADALYEELLTAYRLYGDSLNMLPEHDTTGLARGLEERCELRLRDIYKRYPADLDMHITQVQNDTLWLYTDRYLKARQRHRKPAQAPDTLDVAPSDTLAAPMAARGV